MTTISKTEIYDKKVCKWVLDNLDKIKYRVITDYKYDPIEKIKEILNKVLKTANGEINVKYSQGKGVNFGRRYAKIGNKELGYQTLLREFRHTLADRLYYDLDIKNCQPTILLQYCKKNNIPCIAVENYVKKRDFILSSMVKKYNLPKEDIKQSFISIIMGGKIRLELINSDTLNAFYNEIQVITNKIVELNPIFNKYAQQKKKYNVNGSVMAYLLQDIEDKILISADKFFAKNGFSSDVLVYDGLMIRKNKVLTQKYIYESQKYIKNETNYDIEFLIKPMNEGYEISDEELNEVDLTDCIIIDSDEHGAKLVLDELKETKDIIFCKERYFHKVKGNIYKEDFSMKNKDTQNKLISIIGSLNLCKKTIKSDGIEEVKPYSKNSTGAKNILTFVYANMEQDENFIEKLWESNVSKLCFNDGFYDFKKKCFVEWEDDNKTYTSIYIEKNYLDYVKNKEADKWIEEHILNPIFGGKAEINYFLQWMARTMAGEYKDKTWAVGLGNRNCGKGVLTYLLEASFGKYVREFNAEEMICTRVGNGDMAKKLGWCIPFEFTRLNISNELKTDDDKDRKMKLDGNIIKSISSGGDTKTARKNFKDEIQFRIQGKMLLMMNEMIGIAPDNAKTTLTTFKFNSEFVDELTEKQQQLNNIEGNQYKFFVADSNIKQTIMENESYQMAFINMIINNYDDKLPKIPDEMKQLNDDYHDNGQDLKNQLIEILNITNDPSDRMLIKDVDEIIKENLGGKVSKSAYKLALDQSGVFTKSITEDKKTARYYIGIKKYEEPTTQVNNVFSMF